MFVLTPDVAVGNYGLQGVNSVTIKRSVNEIGATAIIKVPVTAVLWQVGLPRTHVETAAAIKAGDKVKIRLGYDLRMRTEFIGYVKRVNLKTPVEIECEDAYYLTRWKQVRFSGTQTLAGVLKACGLTVGYAETLTMKNFVIADKSVAYVLAAIKKNYGLSVFFDLDGRVYACRTGAIVGDTVAYELRGNVISDDDLQYHTKGDTKIYIKAIAFQKDGTKIEATKGDKTTVAKTLYFYNVTDLKELATLAQAELERYTFDGYQGRITTFLEPYAAPSMIASITDPIYPQRSGSYLVESVETTFGQSGARRKIEISMRYDEQGNR